MKHLAILEHADRAAVNGKSVQRRAAGQFYTHELIGRSLADAAVRALPIVDRPRVIDPFCGDGRLIEWTIERLAERGATSVVASAWDHDPRSLPTARERIEAAASSHGLDLDLDVWQGDTFDRVVSERARWDIAVTNPPWELLKPDRRELQRLPPELHSGYLAELKAFDRRLASEFQVSQPSRRFAGWGTNLSRVGTEVAARLTGKRGICAVVCPSSLLADSTSATLRRWLFREFAIVDIRHYPAEARLFDAVDVPCCTFVATRGVGPNGTRLVRVNANRAIEDDATVQLDHAWLERRDFSIPIQCGADGIALLRRLDDHSRFSSLEGRQPSALWAGRELDETGRASFTRDAGQHPFVRSLHVQRLAQPKLPTDEFVDTSKREIPSSARHVRLAWRDISRPSQKRRIHATLLPAGPVTGNSVSVAHFRDGDLPRLLALLAVVSSLPFEFQVRSLLMTNHVSLSVMRAARIPELTFDRIRTLAEAACACLDGGGIEAEAGLEWCVADAYGLDFDAWTQIADRFALESSKRDVLDRAWGG